MKTLKSFQLENKFIHIISTSTPIVLTLFLQIVPFPICCHILNSLNYEFQTETRLHKTSSNHLRLTNDISTRLFMPKASDKVNPSAVLREEPTSTINHENENVLRFDSNFKNERTSPTDSYDENGEQ